MTIKLQIPVLSLKNEGKINFPDKDLQYFHRYL